MYVFVMEYYSAIKKEWKLAICCGVCVCVCVCVCVMEYYSAIKKNKNLTFATVWKNLGDILPSEIRQTEKNKYCMIFLICGI